MLQNLSFLFSINFDIFLGMLHKCQHGWIPLKKLWGAAANGQDHSHNFFNGIPYAPGVGKGKQRFPTIKILF